MPQCTEAERKMIDLIRKGAAEGASYVMIDDALYEEAMAKAPADFFETAVGVFTRIIEAHQARSAFFEKAEPMGFTGGSKGPMARLWDAAEKEANRRTKEQP